MPVFKNHYVIINIWTSEKNGTLKDVSADHISFITNNGIRETYASLWSGDRKLNKPDFFQKPLIKKIFSNILKRPASYKQDYEQDCVLEALHEERVRHISDIRECLPDEVAYQVNRTTGNFEKLTIMPSALGADETIWAIKLLPANYRVVLYSLDVHRIEEQFNRFKDSDYIPSWTMAGSNLVTQNINFSGKTTENCTSLAYRCLRAGGLYGSEEFGAKVLSAPKDFRLVIVAKVNESELYHGNPEDWQVPGLDETLIDDLISSYNAEKHSANADSKNNHLFNIRQHNKMSKISYAKARDILNQSCERYVSHNETQLKSLVGDFEQFHGADLTALMAFSSHYPRSGFYGCIAYEYAYLFHDILNLHCINPDYQEESNPFCASDRRFFPNEGFDPNYLNEREYVSPLIAADKLRVLSDLMHHVMVHMNKESDFNKKLEEYKSKTVNYNLCLETDPPSVQAYKALMNLKILINFVHTLPKYHSKGITSLLHRFNMLLPTFEGYIKGIAVQELQTILNDPALKDEEAIRKVAVQLENPATQEILEKNRQSQIEHILKVLSVVLIAVGIGIIPTLFLAAKRLYDTGGTSVNFFKPLSKNLLEDADNITLNSTQAL